MPNNNHGFVNEIKNYEIIRKFIKQLFLYGNKSSKQLANSKEYGSTTNLSYLIKRIKNYLTENTYKTNTIKENGVSIKSEAILYDPLSYPINILTTTFQECRFDVHDIMFYFTLMQMFTDYSIDSEDDDICIPYELLKDYETSFILSTSNNTANQEGLITDFFDIITKKKELLYNEGAVKFNHKQLSEPPFSSQTFRKHFNKLKDSLGIFIDVAPELEDSYSHLNKEAIISKTKDRGNVQYYKLSNDIFESIRDNIDTMYNLLDFINFFYNHSDIAIPGWQLSNTLKTYMYTNGAVDIDEKEEPIFQFNDSNALNVIDNDIFWSLIIAIHNHKAVSFSYEAKDNVLTAKIFPIKIICERHYGRQYIFSYSYSDRDFLIYRLDRISNVEGLNISDDCKYPFIPCNSLSNLDEELEKIYQNVFLHTWNVDINGYDNPQKVLIHFYGTPNYIKIIKKEVLMKKGLGKIINESTERFDYITTVTSTTEMIPWIRHFGDHASVDEETNPELYQRIKNELTEILKRYEPI